MKALVERLTRLGLHEAAQIVERHERTVVELRAAKQIDPNKLRRILGEELSGDEVRVDLFRVDKLRDDHAESFRADFEALSKALARVSVRIAKGEAR